MRGREERSWEGRGGGMGRERQGRLERKGDKEGRGMGRGGREKGAEREV